MARSERDTIPRDETTRRGGSLSHVFRATSNSETAPANLGWPEVEIGFFTAGSPAADKLILVKGLILAQNERWRRGLGMQVERIPL